MVVEKHKSRKLIVDLCKADEHNLLLHKRTLDHTKRGVGNTLSPSSSLPLPLYLPLWPGSSIQPLSTSQGHAPTSLTADDAATGLPNILRRTPFPYPTPFMANPFSHSFLSFPLSLSSQHPPISYLLISNVVSLQCCVRLFPSSSF